VTVLKEHALGMTLASSAKLSDKAKLDVLQRLDQFRQWHCLDEKRYCLVCGEMITGREINVIGAEAATGRLRIVCPTEHCNAVPMEWVWPTDGVLITIATMDAERQWLRLITRAGSAMQSLEKKTTSNTISRKRPRPPLG
jgi:hypothetical protein